MPSQLKLCHNASLVVAALMMCAASAGLLWPELYPATGETRARLQSQDMITLFAVPLLLFGLWSARRGSLRGHLLWLGALGHVAYTYANLALGVPFNPLFLLYIALMSLSLCALIGGVIHRGIDAIEDQPSARAPLRATATFLIVTGVFFASLWLIAVAKATGDNTPLPPPGQQVFAQDLGFVIPALLIGGFLLWQRRPMGLVLAGILLFRLTALGLASLGNVLFVSAAGRPVSWGIAAIFATLAVAAAILGTLLLIHLPGRPSR
jgi:hypothetical protein